MYIYIYTNPIYLRKFGLSAGEKWKYTKRLQDQIQAAPTCSENSCSLTLNCRQV